VSLREAWEAEAADWIRLARERDHFAWLFNLPAFLELLPPPGRLTIDLGCGEGRVARELKKRSHNVLTEHRYEYDARPDGIEFAFHAVHRPLSAYFAAIEAAGLAVERFREPLPGEALLAAVPRAQRWTHTPCFLHLVAVKR
jgi:SAM-dependent methyltransferase